MIYFEVASLSARLGELLKNIEIFSWNDFYTNSMNKLKYLIVEASVLANFDRNKKIMLQCDNSKDGIGCILMVDDQSVAFISRNFTNIEKRLVQIEKEFLSIVKIIFIEDK